jgi:lysozyme
VARKHKAGDHAGAAAAFALWNKSKGKVLAGLTRRRAAEAALYREDWAALRQHTQGAVQ